MADIKLFVAATFIVFVKAADSQNDNQDCVPFYWQAIALGLAILLVIIVIIEVAKDCFPRCVNAKGVGEDESQISIISSRELMSVSIQNTKENVSSKIGGSFGKRDSRQLSLDMNVVQMDNGRSPSISFEPATPSRDSSPEDAQPASPLSTEWVASNPPPPPPETQLWVPSTARRRSVSLRGDSDDEKDEKTVCSYCGGSISHSDSASPVGSMFLERKRSVTFNQNVEEIHVLSNEPKKNRSRSPSLLLSAPFYAR